MDQDRHWIGRVAEIPGVNAQERTRGRLLDPLAQATGGQTVAVAIQDVPADDSEEYKVPVH